MTLIHFVSHTELSSFIYIVYMVLQNWHHRKLKDVLEKRFGNTHVETYVEDSSPTFTLFYPVYKKYCSRR